MSLTQNFKIQKQNESLQRWHDDIARRCNHPCINIDMTMTNISHKRIVIMELSERGIPFKIYNLGCGVTRITTKTDICPCCQRAF